MVESIVEVPRATAGGNIDNIKVFRRRWVFLAVFSLLSSMNSFQWVQYAIVSDSVHIYYGVSSQAVDWLSMVYMVMYLPCLVPASWMLENKGLRFTLLVAALLNCTGSWLKVASNGPDLFAFTMVGQTLAAISQAFILAVPARLAAVWFGEGEVATACCIGVFGNQMGTAFGFVLPPLIVTSSARNELGYQMSIVYWGVAAASTLSLLLLVFVFQDAPPVPPSHAQAKAIAESSNSSAGTVTRSMLCIMRSPGFGLLFISYGISVGVFYAVSTVLNALIRSVFKGSEDAGNIGLVLVVAGMLGTVICGKLVDATRKYKEITLTVYFLSLVGMIVFAVSFLTSTMWVVYVTTAFLGFFLTGYLALGFEVAAELTYPEPEGTSAGLLNMSAQVFGIIFTELCGLPLAGVDDRAPTNAHLWVNGFLTCTLLVGTVLTALIPRNLRRQAATNGNHGNKTPEESVDRSRSSNST